MENNPIVLAKRIIESTNSNLFLTGKAGTGKTTFLRRLRHDMPKRLVVLAPTGIAAINAEGMTIHSFFQLPFAPFIPGMIYQQQHQYKISKQKLKLVRSLDLLVIDEVSMVRADLLDAIDHSLRMMRHSSLPFGGVQLLLIGDLQQLPPVINDDTWAILHQYYDTPFFFSSLALKKTNYITIELEKVYRQTDPKFIGLLNKVRVGDVDSITLSEINKRFIPDFIPKSEDCYIQLMTHNSKVDTINTYELEKLQERPYHFEAVINGKFPESAYPTAAHLVLKRGAQIMFIKNDVNKKFFNGMIGTIVDVDERKLVVSPNSDPDLQIMLEPEVWTSVHYGLDKTNNEIKEIVDGTFTQYPVKLAWAITVHKSQGLTFDKVIIDVADSFSHGQTYVALSRCKTLDGIVLSQPIPFSSIISDKNITDFTEKVRLKKVNESDIVNLERSYTKSLLTDLFSFETERKKLSLILHFLEEYFQADYPETTAQYREELKKFDMEVIHVANKFQNQCQRIIYDSEESFTMDFLQERIYKASHYFLCKLDSLESILSNTNLPIDNVEKSKRLNQTFNDAIQSINFHINLLLYIEDYGFDTASYLKKKTQFLLESDEKSAHKHNNSDNRSDKHLSDQPITYDIKNNELFNSLRLWRNRKAQSLSIAPFRILSNKTLVAISNQIPVYEDELLNIPFIGKKKLENFGSEILGIVRDFTERHSNETISKDVKKIMTIKEKQGKTQETSLKMYLNGESPANIARIRNLTLSTILGHLFNYVESGEVDFFDLVNRNNYLKISAYLSTHPRDENTKLSTVKHELDDKITYDEIKLTINKLNW